MTGKEESKKLDLPELMLLEDYGGDFKLYDEAVYQIFIEHFKKSKPTFQGRRVLLRYKPYHEEEKDWNYSKLCCGGEDGTNNIDPLRMQRLAWIKHILEKCPCDQIKIYPEKSEVIRSKRGKKKTEIQDRLILLYEYDRYMVVLTDKKEYVVLWTAYKPREKYFANKLKKYEEYIKNEAAQT